ncbi:MAG: hypothetical protein Q8P60_01315 [Pseudorhodobacter sp.]|nr:hypothetical protein [Pseudorhodobacter sp.]
MKRLWQKHPLLILAFGLAMVLTLVFSVRVAMFAPHWRGSDIAAQPIQGWMTPRLIMHAYDVPPEIVAQALAIPEHSNLRLPLSELAKTRGVTVDTLLVTLNAAIAAYHESLAK